MKKNKAKSIQDVLKKVKSSGKVGKNLDEALVRKAWKEIAGDGLNTYVDSISYKGGSLTIRTNNASLKQELTFSRELLLKRLEEECGRRVVEEIKVY